MSEVVVPVTGAFLEQPVRLQVQVSQAAVNAAEKADPEKDVSIFRRKQEAGEPFDLDDVGRSIAAIANSVTGALRQVRPDEAEVEFGVDIGVESGQLTSLLVKGTASATLKVRLLWTKESSDKDADGT